MASKAVEEFAAATAKEGVALSRLTLQPDSPAEKKALIGVHVSLLADLLHLPKGIESKTAWYDPRTEEILIHVRGDGLPDDCMWRPGGWHLPELRVFLKIRKAVTMDDKPEEVDYIEFDRFA